MDAKYIDCFFIRNKHVVAFTILDMDARLFKIKFKASNGLKVESISNPELDYECIYLRGDREYKDYDIVKIKFETEEEAKEYIEKAEQAIYEMCDYLDKKPAKIDEVGYIYITQIKR